MATSAPASFQSFMGTNGVQKTNSSALCLCHLRILRCLVEHRAKVNEAQTDEKLQIARLPTCL